MAKNQHQGSQDTLTSKQRNALLVTIYAMGFIAAFNENIVNVALLEITESLGVAASTAQWLITGYMIVTSIITASIGFLSRRFTTRQLFFVSAACLVAGEAACLVAPSFAVLLPCRLIQAVGSGIFLPLMMIVVLAVAPRERTGLFISIGGACITLGPAFGPVLSGLMATLMGWRGIFVLPLAFGVLFALLGIKTVRNVGDTAPVSLDPASLALMAAGLTLFVFGMGQVSSSLVLGLGCVVCAVVLIGVFLRRQARIDNPLLDVRPLSNAAFLPAALLVMVAMMMTFSMSVLLPLYYEGVYEQGALMAGMLILPAIVVNAVTSLLGGRAMDARGAWPLLPAGFALIAIGQVLVALTSTSMRMVAVVLLSVLVYAGVGLVLSPSQTAGLRNLPADQQGSGTAILNTLLMVAASIGSSLFVGVFSTSAASSAEAGATAALAQATGFSHAVWLAAGIAACGLALSFWYARSLGTQRSGQ